MSKPSKEIEDRVTKLKDTIDYHRYLYHVLDRQEISEAALDSLKHELAGLEQEYPSLLAADSPTQRVGGAPLPYFKKVRHKVAQWSFNDAFSEEEVRDFDARVKRMLRTALGASVEPTYTAELKIDGLKIVLTYEKGLFRGAATRGDGVVGEEVTENVKTIESVPLRLREPASVVVEGEVWMSKEGLKRLNLDRKKRGESLFANPRNAAAGSIRQLDPKIAAERELDSFIYDLAFIEKEPSKTQEEELHYLQKLGFKVNHHYAFCQTIEEALAFWRRWEKKADEEEYLIDGVALKVNEKKYQDALGYTGKAPRFAVAVKFAAKQATTVLENIIFQVGRTGVITPVAVLRPVSIAGSVVSRATLHNEDEIKRLDVRIGDTVVLQKAGDVIPAIVKVVAEMRQGREKPFVWPKKILECGGDGAIERVSGEVAWRCKDRDSFAIQRRKFYHFVSKHAFDIEHVGPKNIDALFDAKLVAHFDDIFTLTRGDLLSLPRFAEKSADNMLAAIEKAKQVTLPRFIVALSIPHVGEETAEELADYFGDIHALRTASQEKLDALPHVGTVMSHAVRAWFLQKENQELLDRLLRQVRIQKQAKRMKEKLPLAGKIFVLTGVFTSMSREQAKQKIKSQGGDVAGSVSKNTDFVVAGAEAGSKYEKAKELRVKILAEKELLDMLKK